MPSLTATASRAAVHQQADDHPDRYIDNVDTKTGTNMVEEWNDAGANALENAGKVAKRAGTPDEVGAVGALLMGPDGGFITGSDFLMDGGVTAAYWYGDVAEVRAQ